MTAFSSHLSLEFPSFTAVPVTGEGELSAFSFQAKKPDLSGDAFQHFRDPSSEDDKPKKLQSLSRQQLEDLFVNRFVKKASREVAAWCEATREQFIDDFLRNYKPTKAKPQLLEPKPENKEGARQVALPESAALAEPGHSIRKAKLLQKPESQSARPTVHVLRKRPVPCAGVLIDDQATKKAREETAQEALKKAAQKDEFIVSSDEQAKLEWLSPGAEADALKTMERERREQDVEEAFLQFARLSVQSPRVKQQATVSKNASYIA